MGRRLSSLVVVAALAAAGLWVWHACIPSPEKAIRHRLKELARTASFGPNEGGLARMRYGQELAGFFAENAEVRLDVGNTVATKGGRAQLRDTAVGVRMTLDSLQVDFQDLNVVLGADGHSAEVDLTAVGRIPSEPDLQVCELKFLLTRTGGDWLIRRVETVRTPR